MNTVIAYLLAVMGVTGIGCGSILALELARPEGYNAQAAYTILGICTTVLTVLLGIIKGIGNSQQIEANTRLTAQTAATVTEVAKATGIAPPTPAAVQDVLEKSVPRP